MILRSEYSYHNSSLTSLINGFLLTELSLIIASWLRLEFQLNISLIQSIRQQWLPFALAPLIWGVLYFVSGLLSIFTSDQPINRLLRAWIAATVTAALFFIMGNSLFPTSTHIIPLYFWTISLFLFGIYHLIFSLVPPKKADYITFINKDRYYIYVLSIIAIGSAILRLFRLGTQSIWLDEAFTYIDSIASIPHIFFQRIFPETAPLSFLLSHWSMSLLGRTDFALRLPSAIAGILCVPALAYFGAVLYKRSVGLVAAFLITLSPMAIHFSQEARTYSFLNLFSILSSIALWKALEEKKGRWWLAFILINFLGILNHYEFLIILAVELGFFMIWLITQLDHSGKKALGLFSLNLGFIVFFAWILKLDIFGSVGFLTQQAGSFTAGDFQKRLDVFFEFFRWVHLYGNLFIIVLFLFMGFLGLLGWKMRQYSSQTIYLALLAVVPILLLLVRKDTVSTALYTRHFTIILPYYLLLVAYGISILYQAAWSMLNTLLLKVKVSPKPIFLTALISVGMLLPSVIPGAKALSLYYNFTPGYNRNKPEWKEAANFIEGNWKPGQLVLTAGPNSHLTISRYLPTIAVNNQDELLYWINSRRPGYLLINSWETQGIKVPQEFHLIKKFTMVQIYSLPSDKQILTQQIQINPIGNDREQFIRPKGMIGPTGWWEYPFLDSGKMYGVASDKAAVIEVILDSQKDYSLTIPLRPQFYDQNLQVKVNGNFLPDSIPLSAAEWITATIKLPSTILQQGLNKIELIHQAMNIPNQPNRMIGTTGVEAATDITVDGAPWNLGNHALIFVGDQVFDYTLAGKGYGRGYTVVAFTKEGKLIDWDAFDTCCGEGEHDPAQESARFAQFIQKLPKGTIVALASKDDAINGLTQDAKKALQSIGSGVDLGGKFRWEHILIGVKGAAPNTALEEVSQGTTSLVVGNDSRKNFLLVGIITLTPSN